MTDEIHSPSMLLTAWQTNIKGPVSTHIEICRDDKLSSKTMPEIQVAFSCTVLPGDPHVERHYEHPSHVNLTVKLLLLRERP